MVIVGALPLLFAAPSALRSPPLGGTGANRIRGITSLQSTVENEPFTLRDVVEQSKSTYRNLATGCFTSEATPTISFHYMRPPSERTSDDEAAIPLFGEGDIVHGLNDGQIYEKIQDTHDNTKPLLLYLPGLDGVGISAIQQYDDLSNTFELWRMQIDQTEDRSTFSELTTAVSNFIQEIAVHQNRKVILVGESFGGLLAPSVAMRMQSLSGKEESPVMGMVLVNPATSFFRTNWSTWAPILASLRHMELEEEAEGLISNLPTPYSVLGGIALSMTIPDSTQYRNIFDIFSRTTVDELRDVLTTMRDGFGLLAENLPAKVIEHRVKQWCVVGSQVVNSRLCKLTTPTLFIGGDEDNMLPSKEEGDRLIELMPDCTSMQVKDAGHFILDDRFNLTQAIVDAPFDPFNKKKHEKKYDAITDWVKPTDEEIQEAIDNRVKPLRDLFSPQFFSTGDDGRRTFGLGKVPSNEDKPLLFVANHQLIGLDLGKSCSKLFYYCSSVSSLCYHPLYF